MSTIQSQMQLYHAIETALRDATNQQHPMTLQDVYDRADVAAAARSKAQVRDKISVLVNHKLVTKVSVAQGQSGNRMERVAYLWAQMDKHVEDELNPRAVDAGAIGGTAKHQKQEPEPSHSVEVEINGMVVYAGKGVEMYIQNVKCVVDKNPASGLVRIKIA